MPLVQGSAAFNIGRDCQITLVGPFGQVEIPNVTSFDCKQETAKVRVDRLDGVQLRATLPKGWTGSFSADRGSNDLDGLFADIEAAWYSAGVVQASTMYQRIVEPGGGVTTYQFDNVSLELTNAGAWKGDAQVTQTVSFEANRRTPV